MDYRKEAEIYGQQFINELDEPEAYEPYTNSDGSYRYLHVYHKQSCDRMLTLRARTWRELFETARETWNAHVFMKRGF